MNKEQRSEIIGLSEDEKKEIKREVLRDLNPNKYTDSYFNSSETSIKNFRLVDELIEKAKYMKGRNGIDEAKRIIEKCILEYNAVQPEVYYMAAELITEKEVLKNILQHYEDNEYLFQSKKLKRPVSEIKARYEYNL